MLSNRENGRRAFLSANPSHKAHLSYASAASSCPYNTSVGSSSVSSPHLQSPQRETAHPIRIATPESWAGSPTRTCQAAAHPPDRAYFRASICLKSEAPRFQHWYLAPVLYRTRRPPHRLSGICEIAFAVARTIALRRHWRSQGNRLVCQLLDRF